jgi:hypothetical protein
MVFDPQLRNTEWLPSNEYPYVQFCKPNGTPVSWMSKDIWAPNKTKANKDSDLKHFSTGLIKLSQENMVGSNIVPILS